MQLQPPTLSGSVLVPGTVCTITGIVIATVVTFELSNYRKLDGIPTFGSCDWLGSWWASRKFKSDAHILIQEGYVQKAQGITVQDCRRLALGGGVVSGREQIEELGKATEDVLSKHVAVNNLEYTLGREMIHNPYHHAVIRGNLTRNLSNLYPEIRDEISVAFGELLDLEDNEWKTVSVLSTVEKVVCRVSNRLFVGLPLCRDPDWIDINLRYTLDVVKGGNKIRRFANFLVPVVVRFMTNVPTSKERALKHLAPMIEERLRLLKEHGNDWDKRPDDMLSWLLKEAPEGAERTVWLLTNRMLTVNFTAIHTTPNSFAQALLFLAEDPQYVQPLREEMEAIVQKEGWSKASLGKMHKIDSFLKECQRMTAHGLLGLVRVAVKDFTFSDGTFIPKGTFVAVPMAPLHLDNELYENAHVFTPFRFSDMRDEDGKGTKHNLVSTSPEYLPFGHGKHVCPGRFFAADELKSMLAHVVVTYDVKLEDNKPRPEGLRIGTVLFADPSSKVMFRERDC